MKKRPRLAHLKKLPSYNKTMTKLNYFLLSSYLKNATVRRRRSKFSIIKVILAITLCTKLTALSG